MLNIVLFGPPGAGKGTQSQKLIARYNLVHLSTGDLLRSQIAQGTELGLRAKKLMDEGLLVPDEVVIGMIESQLANNTSAAGFIFDGFPRTVPQAESLDALTQRYNTGVTCMVALEVNEEELVTRLLERGKTSGRPDDQDETKIRKRVTVYNTETAQVAGYYATQGKFHALNGIGAIEDIFGQICAIIDRHQGAATSVTDSQEATDEVKA
ncbi:MULTISPECIES: adenylate kinase [Hymenobacter]|uniref:Adenylate kinase n=1 Tax=Hymenobacter jejuensis TaxID=2502781 RepID=A0A5B7ZWH8_9BACT|nr:MULTISPECIES: adenylate kinase [Hymenobacter]MBC6988314.1 adenylate kinase [Hymenobacter sp. BT491]QDA59328.1 adenylate kinase [Hymenobacter jejuensis]